MSEQKLYNGLISLGIGIDACLKQQMTAPALILVYSAIDTTGWLDSEQPYATRDSFVNWVARYLLKAKPLACTAMDLYAARCGLLHTFTPDSHLSSEGKARRICYAWGHAKVEDLQRTIELTNTTSQYVAVHVEELYEAWRLGLLAFIEIIDNDMEKKSKVYAKANQFFDELGMAPVQKFLDIRDQH